MIGPIALGFQAFSFTFIKCSKIGLLVSFLKDGCHALNQFKIARHPENRIAENNL